MEAKTLKKKAIFILILILIIIGIIFLIFFKTNMSKNSKIGNNTSSQEIIDYILNINSYETEIKVEVKSNKNINKYRIKQTYKNSNESSQEILEPNNISGIKITKSNGKLKVENTNLNLSSLYENYEYVSDNSLDLNSFIKDYKESKKSNWNEEQNAVIMQTEKDGKEKTLYIDKTTKNPTKLEVKDMNKKTEVYISYNEINIK